MLNEFFPDPLSLALAQAGVVIVLALAVMGLAQAQRIGMKGEIALALVRGIVQVVAVGSVLLIVFRGPLWLSAPVLATMILLAATIMTRRAKGIPGAFIVSLYGIALGGGGVILLMTWLGIIDHALTSLIPIGSMLIANAMNTNSLALERFRSEVTAQRGTIEAALSLGADPRVAVAPCVHAAIRAGLIPRIDSLRSLGIVWIPGLMAGMILAGSDPIHAAIYQFVVIAMIFAVSGLTSLISGLLIRHRVFSPAQQLILLPRKER